MIVPFAGTPAGLGRLVDELTGLSRREGDELIVADNRGRGSVSRAPREAATPARETIRICAADGVRTPGFARNCAARIATGEWLVFIDSDTRPSPQLLDAYFDPPPLPRTAILAGGIVDVTDRASLAARHSLAREHMSQRATLARRGRPYAQTANCAVLRSAFNAVGGFSERIRAGEDADLCFRLADAGWRLEERPRAGVEHRGRDSLGPLLVQLARHGSGAAWLNRRYPGEFPAPRPLELVGRVARTSRAASLALARGELGSAVLALLDLVTAGAFDLGRLLPNGARARA